MNCTNCGAIMIFPSGQLTHDTPFCPTCDANDLSKAEDKIIQTSGFRIGPEDEWFYYLVATTQSGRVLISTGNGEWADVTRKTIPNKR